MLVPSTSIRSEASAFVAPGAPAARARGRNVVVACPSHLFQGNIPQCFTTQKGNIRALVSGCPPAIDLGHTDTEDRLRDSSGFVFGDGAHK